MEKPNLKINSAQFKFLSRNRGDEKGKRALFFLMINILSFIYWKTSGDVWNGETAHIKRTRILGSISVIEKTCPPSTTNIKKMCLRLILVLIVCFAFASSIPVVVYNDTRFDPVDIQTQLIHLTSVTTRDACICQCYADSSCITGTFIGVNKICILYSAGLEQGKIRLMINSNAAVITIPSRLMKSSK